MDRTLVGGAVSAKTSYLIEKVDSLYLHIPGLSLTSCASQLVKSGGKPSSLVKRTHRQIPSWDGQYVAIGKPFDI